MTILKETPWYKEIVNEGVKLGRQEGVQQGKLAIEQSLLVVLAHRFGTVPLDVRETLDKLSLTQLQAAFDDALKSNTWDEFRASLPQTPE